MRTNERASECLGSAKFPMERFPATTLPFLRLRETRRRSRIRSGRGLESPVLTKARAKRCSARPLQDFLLTTSQAAVAVESVGRGSERVCSALVLVPFPLSGEFCKKHSGFLARITRPPSKRNTQRPAKRFPMQIIF